MCVFVKERGIQEESSQDRPDRRAPTVLRVPLSIPEHLHRQHPCVDRGVEEDHAKNAHGKEVHLQGCRAAGGRMSLHCKTGTSCSIQCPLLTGCELMRTIKWSNQCNGKSIQSPKGARLLKITAQALQFKRPALACISWWKYHTRPPHATKIKICKSRCTACKAKGREQSRKQSRSIFPHNKQCGTTRGQVPALSL